MAEWQEAEHPRDDIGRFTYKNGGTSNSDYEKREQEMQKRADVLYPTMRDKGETSTGGAADVTVKHLLNEMVVDDIDNRILKTVNGAIIGKEATENLLMSKADSYLNTDYAHEHFVLKNCYELNKDLRAYFEKKIKSQTKINNINDIGGIFIDAKSDSSIKLSKELLKNPGFMEELSKDLNALRRGVHVEKDNLSFNKGNFYYALHFADVKDMHINKEGNLDLLVTDVYDFNKNDKSDLVQVARERQDRGEIKPYFIIYHVIIPKEKLK